jgi:hypothetical protein
VGIVDAGAEYIRPAFQAEKQIVGLSNLPNMPLDGGPIAVMTTVPVAASWSAFGG